jgi:phage-related protein
MSSKPTVKLIKEKLHNIKESVEKQIENVQESIDTVKDEHKSIIKEQGGGIKQEFKDIEKIRHHKDLIYYKSDALVIVIRKLGGFDEFLKMVDDLTREGYWMMNSEDVKNLLANFGISIPGINRGTLYYFQNKKYIN